MFSRSEIQNLIDYKPPQLAPITYNPKYCQIEIYEPRLLSNPSNRDRKSDPRGTFFVLNRKRIGGALKVNCVNEQTVSFILGYKEHYSGFGAFILVQVKVMKL